jgi:hypothetical protein
MLEGCRWRGEEGEMRGDMRGEGEGGRWKGMGLYFEDFEIRSSHCEFMKGSG